MLRRLYLVFTFLTLSSSCFSQEYFIQNFSMENGLPNNQLHNIIQAQDNTLWFTTFYGFTQYDGTNFTVYTEDDGMISNHTLNVFEDSKGRIWVCPWNRKGINRIDNGKVITFNDSVLDTKWMMNAAYEDKKGRIWFFGTRAVYKFENESFELVYKSKSDADYYHPNELSVINDNRLYLTQMEGGVIEVTLEPFAITKRINSDSHGINNICYSTFKDRDGRFWFGCYGAIYSYENDEMIEHKIPIEFDKCRVWDITEDKDGYLWLATYGGGIVRWDKKDEFIIINSNNGLSDDYCYSILIDNENNKWIANDITGLDKLGDLSFQYYTTLSGLKSNLIFGVTQKENDDIVVGTDKGFAVIKDNKVDTTIYEDYSIYYIKKDKEDKVWYASKTGYGYLDDNYSNTNYDHSNIYGFIDTEDKIVTGLSRVLKDQREVFFMEFLLIPSAFYLGDILYIATNYGLIKKEKNKKISQLEQLPNDVFSEISTSLKISRDEVLVSNPNELVYIKNLGESLEIKRFSSKKLGGINRIFSILLDSNDLWVGAHNTLAKINYDQLINHNQLIMEKYGVSDGMLPGLTAPNAIYKDKEGVIWVGMSTGLVKFNPKLIRKNKLPPILKLKEVKLFSRAIGDNFFTEDKKVKFSYNQNHLTFDIQAISLSSPKKVKCKYRLIGLSDEWSDPISVHPISFPFLNPGKYTFEFIASNGEGVWTEKPLRFSFVVSPPFWKTSWFLSLVVFFILFGIAYLFYRQRSKSLRVQRVQEKFTRDIIEAQEEERKRISKGLHDGIGQSLLLIKNSLRTKNVEDSEKMVSSTIEEVRSISRNLHPFQLEKFGLTKALESMVEELNESVEKTVFTEEIDNIDGVFSKEQEINLYRIIQECFNNILKHANATAARIIIKKTNRFINITILDNGKGFDLEKNKDLVNSLGLKSIRERIKYLKGSVSFNSKLNKGTTIKIQIAYEFR